MDYQTIDAILGVAFWFMVATLFMLMPVMFIHAYEGRGKQ